MTLYNVHRSFGGHLLEVFLVGKRKPCEHSIETLDFLGIRQLGLVRHTQALMFTSF